MKRLLIIGCGDIGRRVGRQLAEQDVEVVGLVRSEAGAKAAEAAGIKPLIADLMDADSLSDLPTEGAHVIYAAPPPGGGLTDPKVANFCRTIRSDRLPARIVYLSTSGVYGDCGGRIIDEQTPVNPQTSRAKRRLDAEMSLRTFGELNNIPVVILRVTGIYGPFRFALHRILEKHPLLREEEASFTNRIHADDLARVCLAALERAEGGEVYNVCDGQESTMTHYFNAVADAFGLERPPQVTSAEADKVMNPLMLSYFRESRRMKNSRMLELLGADLLYPTLEDGLKASVEEMRRTDPAFFDRLAQMAKSLA
ncbi:MAG: SDR family oxidoreductase [Geothermobacteraceae bacterium]